MVVKGHVFLVDDDDDIRFHLGDMLRLLGYGVSDYASPPVFLQQAHRTSPAVLVLDMRMPQMTGLELHKELHKKDWPLPIIYMSGDSQSQEIIDAMKLGVIDFLWKPFTQIQMVQAIEKGLVQDAQRHADLQRLKLVKSLYESLSPREQSMFALMLLGHGNKEIAASTGVMADTVKKHRAQVLTKMQVKSLSELLAFCKGFTPLAPVR